MRTFESWVPRIRFKQFHKETNAANARVKRLKARRGELGEDNWRDRGTEPTRLDTDKPGDGIKAIPRKYRPIFPAISKHATDGDIYLEIVCPVL